MSELIQKHDNCATIRWKLLTSASALALTISCVTAAKADDTDRPTIWIELGGQMEHIGGQGEPFTPGFLAAYPDSSVVWQGVTPLQAQKPTTFGFGEEGSITFQPEGSDWVFSAGLRYGRSSNRRHVDHQTNGIHHQKYQSGVPYAPSIHPYFTQEKFANTQAHNQESHAILDFQAGKDVGLGMFGRDASSILSLGVRFAQFTSSAAFDVRARPDLHFKYFPSAAAPTHFEFPYFHTYHASGSASRSFRGVGPSLSWNGSAPFAGNPQSGEIAFDWGANAALLFGKQKAHVRHQESGHYVNNAAFQQCGFGTIVPCYYVVYHHSNLGHDTDRSVTVPNAGGFVGLSYRYADAKLSLGYRADFFFGAMDVGIDARKNGTLGFKGPYASISVGLGD